MFTPLNNILGVMTVFFLHKIMLSKVYCRSGCYIFTGKWYADSMTYTRNMVELLFFYITLQWILHTVLILFHLTFSNSYEKILDKGYFFQPCYIFIFSFQSRFDNYILFVKVWIQLKVIKTYFKLKELNHSDSKI